MWTDSGSKEDRLISCFCGVVPLANEHTVLGIGDDAAVLKLTGNLLATTDMLMEDIHFRKSWGELGLLGKKAILQNISDIAAMGGTPVSALISIAIPNSYTHTEIMEIYEGISAAAREYDITISGGDTINSSEKLVISVTMLGTIGDDFPCRNGAKIGDVIAVTGTLGAAGIGVKLLDSGVRLTSANDVERELISAQLCPVPRVKEGMILKNIVNAMMDISDGIGRDLRRICAQSGVGAVVNADKIPVHVGVENYTGDPINAAVSGGEDFELLVTLDSADFEKARETIAPTPLTVIGTITEKSDILLEKQGEYTVLSDGFSHF